MIRASGNYFRNYFQGCFFKDVTEQELKKGEKIEGKERN